MTLQLFRGVWHRLNCGPLEMFLLYFMKDCLPFSSWVRLCGDSSQLIVCLSKGFPLCYNDGKYCFSKWLRCIKSEKSLRQDKVERVKNESKSFGYLQKMRSFPLQWDSHGEAISEWEKRHSTCTKDSEVWGCLSRKDMGCPGLHADPSLGISTRGWKQMENFVHCAANGGPGSQMPEMFLAFPDSPWHSSPGSSVPGSCKFVS